MHILLFFCIFSFFSCNAQLSKLPKEMPTTAKMSFSEHAGMANAFKEIKIIGDTLSIKEKKAESSEIENHVGRIELADKRNLYKVFVKNRFDVIKNDKTINGPNDRSSEEVRIDLSPNYNLSHFIYYSALNEDNLTRYNAVKSAIFELYEKYKNKLKKHKQ